MWNSRCTNQLGLTVLFIALYVLGDQSRNIRTPQRMISVRQRSRNEQCNFSKFSVLAELFPWVQSFVTISIKRVLFRKVDNLMAQDECSPSIQDGPDLSSLGTWRSGVNYMSPSRLAPFYCEVVLIDFGFPLLSTYSSRIIPLAIAQQTANQCSSASNLRRVSSKEWRLGIWVQTKLVRLFNCRHSESWGGFAVWHSAAVPLRICDMRVVIILLCCMYSSQRTSDAAWIFSENT